MTKTATRTKKAITIEDVLNKKKLLGDDFKSYHSNYFDRDFTIDKVKPEVITDIMAGEGTEFEKYKQLIYNSCSFFRAKELIKELEVDIPYDVVEAVYDDNYAEIFEFGNLILKRYGFTEDRVESVKKPL